MSQNEPQIAIYKSSARWMTLARSARDMRNSMNKVSFKGNLSVGNERQGGWLFWGNDLSRIATLEQRNYDCSVSSLQASHFIYSDQQSAVWNESFTPQKWNLNFVEKLLIAVDAFGPRWWMWKCDNTDSKAILRREKISRRQLKLHCKIMLIGLRVVYANDICVNDHKTPENGNGTWADRSTLCRQ